MAWHIAMDMVRHCWAMCTHFIYALISIFVTFLYIFVACEPVTHTHTHVHHGRLLESPRDRNSSNNNNSSCMMTSEIDFPSQFIKNCAILHFHWCCFAFYYYVLFLSVAYSNESMLNKKRLSTNKTANQQTTVPFNESGPLYASSKNYSQKNCKWMQRER